MYVRKSFSPKKFGDFRDVLSETQKTHYLLMKFYDFLQKTQSCL